MKCSSCGAQLGAGERFCSKCGAAATRSQPSREEVRARMQGSGRHAAPARHAAPVRSAAPLGDGDILLLVRAGLGLLTVLFLFLKGAVLLSDTPVKYSLFSGSPFLGVLILLAALAGTACVLLPLLGLDHPLARKAELPLAGGTLLLGILALIAAVNHYTVRDEIFGTKEVLAQASVGFVGVLFLLLCAASAVLAALPRLGAAVPSGQRAAAPRRTPARRTAPTRQAAPVRRSVSGQAQPARQTVTPPDAETIAALRRMAQMHQQGLISDEEFARVKAECVARGWIRA